MANNNKHTGPNVPALRFPEFSGEWETKCLGDISENISSGKTKSTTTGGKYVLIGSTGVIGNTSNADYSGNLILVARVGANAGLINYYSGDCGITDNTLIIKPLEQEKNFCHYVYHYLKHCNLNQFVFGSGQPLITGGMLKRLPIRYGTIDETNKLSSLFDMLDARIEAQSKIIEEQETLLRSLRHKIYSRVQAESQCTIADVLCYEQPTKYLVTDTDYTDDDSQVPVLTANKAFILGYTTENFGIYDKGPCIILDDFTLDCKYVDFKFKVKSSAIKILRAKAKTNLRFIFEYFRFLELNTTEHKRHYIAEIEPMSILLPSNEEIDRIARLFTALDERLEAARKELKILESQKMYMLQKMFI